MFISRAISRVGRKPRHLITDKGSQFTADEFRKYCKRKKIKQRFGVPTSWRVGSKYGSIAVIERFIRSMKDECTRRIIAPLRINEMRNELALYILWYNAYRPLRSRRQARQVFFSDSYSRDRLSQDKSDKETKDQRGKGQHRIWRLRSFVPCLIFGLSYFFASDIRT